MVTPASGHTLADRLISPWVWERETDRASRGRVSELLVVGPWAKVPGEGG